MTKRAGVGARFEFLAWDTAYRRAQADKNTCLIAMAGALDSNAGALKEANALDMDAAANLGLWEEVAVVAMDTRKRLAERVARARAMHAREQAFTETLEGEAGKSFTDL